MIEVKTSEQSYALFLTLTGNAFAKHEYDKNAAHGFYWSMRWLARQVLGPTWMRWLSEPL